MEVISKGITMAREEIVMFKDEPELKKQAIERFKKYNADYDDPSKKVRD